ncbi:hypothetical protein [Noviherbaspirillum pedocola]|uniref:Uncharacterized protein n=1 Tax=Noviherbaspirillum pedocola TaxID=2801341 RepID=A0A934STA2_9BURK|nr:hypothetical protein [Noviherbaspirillum pedocola]MBK4734796.1 hypothetical protein [Noviherbaspirillum pedocola]
MITTTPQQRCPSPPVGEQTTGSESKDIELREVVTWNDALNWKNGTTQSAPSEVEPLIARKAAKKLVAEPEDQTVELPARLLPPLACASMTLISASMIAYGIASLIHASHDTDPKNEITATDQAGSIVAIVAGAITCAGAAALAFAGGRPSRSNAGQ